jgi:ketosteroid isomerase-like protein
MKGRLSSSPLAFLAAAGIVVLTGCTTIGHGGSEPLSPGDLAAAKELDVRFADAVCRKDLDAVMACFWNSPDLVVVELGRVERGPEIVRAGFASMFSSSISVTLTIDDAAYVPAGDEIITYGTATFIYAAGGGTSEEIRERWTDLKRKIDGRWVYVLDHTAIAR